MVLAARYLLQEAHGLLSRIIQLRPFAQSTPMLAAANIPIEAQVSIERLLRLGCRNLSGMVRNYIHRIESFEGDDIPVDLHRRFTFLRLRFNEVLHQFDIFRDVLSQRSEHDTGVWIAGLDDLAADALILPGKYYKPPPVICYLDKGLGASIRRVHTRLPGGEANPVAVIKVPLERMIGSGIASSLVHEVGHQSSALLGLIPSLTPVLLSKKGGMHRNVNSIWARWISEILADFWSVARIGVGSTLGLMSVVSLPKIFVFNVNLDDPHPSPWIRVKLSAAIGNALFPDPQWNSITRLWEMFYPIDTAPDDRQGILRDLDRGIPELIELIVNHRPRSLKGNSLIEALPIAEIAPARLRRVFRGWKEKPSSLRQLAPCLAFATIGQAKADGVIEPQREAALLSNLLSHWAISSALSVSEDCLYNQSSSTQSLRRGAVYA